MSELPPLQPGECVPIEQWGRTVFAFRGYNVTNLGRTRELLHHPRYSAAISRRLAWGSDLASQLQGKRIDLLERVHRAEETDLATFDEAVALIVSVELAHLEILTAEWGPVFTKGLFTFGYSLGEIAALAATGLITPESALKVPLSVAADCAELARDTRMGVVFSRAKQIDLVAVEQVVRDLNQAGPGLLAISAILAPNALLVLGQQQQVRTFKSRVAELPGPKLQVRENPHYWPPLHTPLLWLKHIPSRAGLQVLTMPAGQTVSAPPVLSLAQAATLYTATNYSELLDRWIDHPQLLWSAVSETLRRGAETVVHVGPEPNLIPATLTRLADNINGQLQGNSLYSYGMWAMSRNPWLAQQIVQDAHLLRAPYVRQICLEDWFLAQSG